VADCTDLRTIRWEIVNSCAIQDWERARDLLRQMERLGLIPAADVNMVRGQLLYQAGFLTASDWADDLQLWDPRVETGINPRTLCLHIPALLPDRVEQAADDVDCVRDAANELAKGLAKEPKLPPPYRAMLARCYFAVGEFHNAAVEWKKLHAAGPWPDGELGETLDYLVLLNLASAQELDGATDEAIDTVRSLIERSPQTRGLHARLARLYVKKADYVAAADSLRRECEADPAFGKDYRVEILIALASISENSTQAVIEFQNKLKAFAQSRPELSGLAAAILREHWPAFSQLSPDAQRDWIEATKMLHGQGDGVSLSGPAAFSFVLALENELRQLIFEPFRTEVGDECRRSTEKPPSAPLWYQHFRGYLQGGDKISLGDILCALRGTQSSNERWLEILGQWTARRFPSLFKCLMSLDTKKIVDTRNRHGHPGSREVSKSEAEEIAFSCRLLLDSLFTR
jgi:tetratricopeptide (TPR) repeat protein